MHEMQSIRTTRHFPRIRTVASKKGVEAVAVLKLTSLIKGDLLLDDMGFGKADLSQQHPLSPQKLLEHRAGLLRALSALPPDVTVELHFLFNPAIARVPRGKIHICIFLRAFQKSKPLAKEAIVRHYLAVRPLLANFWSEAEFNPVIDMEEVAYLSAPFKACQALSIQHLEESITLSQPMRSRSVGFSIPKESTENPLVTAIRYPWRRGVDDWAILFNSLLGQLDPLELIVRLKTIPLDQQHLEPFETTLKKCDDFLVSHPAPSATLERQAKIIRQTLLALLLDLHGNAFLMGVFLVSAHPIHETLGQLVGQSISKPLGINSETGQFEGGFMIQSASVDEVRDIRYFMETFPCSPMEAANAFRLPSPPLTELFGLPLKRARTNTASFASPHYDTGYRQELFINDHCGLRQPISVSMDVRMQHVFLLGQTGTGKSTLLEHMILQDIQAGIGVGVIDPHGDLVEDILGKIPEKRVNDVVLIDLMDTDRPIGLNVLEVGSALERDLVIDELYLTLDRIYDFRTTGGPMFEYYFRGMLKLLIGSEPRPGFSPTVLELVLCFNSQKFREWLKASIKDSSLLDFIVEIEKAGGEANLSNISPYITSKMNRFIHNDALKRIVGQDRTALSFDAIMNQGKILLVKLGKGRFGAITSAFIANYLVSCFKRTAMQRGGIPIEKRRDFALYVDECHNLPVENFTELLSEARKFRMALTLATQYTSQLSSSGHNTSSLLSAVLGNVGTFITLRLGPQDAELLGATFKPSFSSADIAALPNWCGYAKIQAGCHHGPAFSFQTVKNYSPYRSEIAGRIIENSRNTYGTSCQDVDRQIAKRQTIWKS